MRMKRCSKCGIDKEMNSFSKDKSSKDGYRCNCKECAKKYRIENSDKIREYRDNNRERTREYGKNRKYDPERKREYYQLNKEEILIKRKMYYFDNKELRIEYQKNYQSNNKDKRNIYLSERRMNDPLFRLITNIRNLINNSFSDMSYSKKSRTHEILGCSFEDLKLYIESKFDIWMDWDNRGLYNGEYNSGWDIDHIIPLSSAKSEDELIKLNHYTNLQPLCSKINRDIKKNNLEYGLV